MSREYLEKTLRRPGLKVTEQRRSNRQNHGPGRLQITA